MPIMSTIEIKAQVWARDATKKMEVVTIVALDGNPRYTGPTGSISIDGSATHTLVAPVNPTLGYVRPEFVFYSWWEQLTGTRVFTNTLTLPPPQPDSAIWWAEYDGPSIDAASALIGGSIGGAALGIIGFLTGKRRG